MRNTMRYLLIVIWSLLFIGCATTPEEDLSDEEVEASALILYKEAKDASDAGDYETAIQRLESLEARFPFGRFAQQARFDIAYAYYKYDEPESAVAAADRFIKLYPRHPNVDYAFYLKGVIKFDQGRGAFDFLKSQDPAKRDPGSARKAYQYFSELVSRYPTSKYVPDAVERMKYLRNNLARSELYAAKFYMRRGAYVAAANRAKHIIEFFQTTPSTPEALSIMVQAYSNLGLQDLSDDALRVLEKSFPKDAHLKKLKSGNTQTPENDQS